MESILCLNPSDVGYYDRGFHGWNNARRRFSYLTHGGPRSRPDQVRYVLANGLLEASLLNRTLVIPSFLHMRSCAYSKAVCSAFGDMVCVQRGPLQSGLALTNGLMNVVSKGHDVAFTSTWHGPPDPEQWAVPIEASHQLSLPHIDVLFLKAVPRASFRPSWISITFDGMSMSSPSPTF